MQPLPSPRILIAMDKFKGSLTAVQAGEAVRRGLQRAGILASCDVCPIADGGEGTSSALVSALNGRWMEAAVQDAIGRAVTARFGFVEAQARAVMEMSAASGLAMVSDQALTPERASTRGTGEMMLAALAAGAHRLVIGIGGSATNDGGMGMAQALGYRFLDAAGAEVLELPLRCDAVMRIERPQQWAVPEVLVACDVDNPLLGPRGATRVYGPQKGVQDFGFFESRLERLADLIARDLGCDHRDVPGAGAAGGLGFGLMSFCGARLVSGFDLVADVTGLRERMMGTCLVITGEGRVDAQTLCGKGPAGVAAMARALGIPCIAVAGLVEDAAALAAVFDATLQAKPETMATAEAMCRGEELVEHAVAAAGDAIRRIAEALRGSAA